MEREALHERITIEAVHTNGGLGRVFTSYSFYVKGKFSHCGANSFPAGKAEREEKIQYLIDPEEKIIVKNLNKFI